MNTNMMGRLFEDGIILVRFGYFFARAPKMSQNLGFTQTGQTLPMRKRAAWAYNKATFRVPD